MIHTLLALAVLLVVTSAGAQAPPAIDVERVVDGLERPVFVTHAGDGRGRLFVIEQPGRIRIVDDGVLEPEPFLDIGDRVRARGEQGLLGLAFHPNYPTNRYFYVNYTRRQDGATVVSRFRARVDRQQVPSSEKVLLIFGQPLSNHNGGMLAFGPDGFLYIGSGDGGGAGDQGNRAQDPDELLGKILRIDVDRGDPYAIPAGNPFADGGGAPEIFALGFRNPWRFSFDRNLGRLRVADVGQGKREEAQIVVAGGNYGWRFKEGTRCFRPRSGCEDAAPELIDPPIEYRHANGRCSITGGYVYRGDAIPELKGTYLYGDFCTGEIFGWRPGGGEVLLRIGARLASFGEDAAGEVYVVDLNGTIYRIVPAG